MVTKLFPPRSIGSGMLKSGDLLDLLVLAESSRLGCEVVIKEPQLSILSRFMATPVDTSPVYTTRAVDSVREADGNYFPSPS